MTEKLIYIVDDQPMICELLGTLLSFHNSSWEVKTFERPADLIHSVTVRPPNLVISDCRMPLMTGAELQDEIRKMAPSTIRILMSGNVASLSKIASAHQYIAKPFVAAEVFAVVTNSLNVQDKLRRQPRLGDIVAGLNSLPVVPAVFHKLIALLDQDTSSTDEIAKLLEKDGGITTRIIQLANSPLFNNGAPVGSAEEAIMCLGLQNIKAVVLSLHAFESYDRLTFPEASVERIWRHCQETAQLAECLCRERKARSHSSNAFLASLLHDLGQLVFMENLSGQYRLVYQEAAATHRPLHEVEQESLGIQSSAITAFLIELWGLPEAVAEAVTSHHAPWQNPHPDFNASDALYVANILARRQNCPDQLETATLNEDYLKSIGAAELATA